MRLFQTRHEIQEARKDIAELRGMIRAHFDIKYTIQDFQKYADLHPGRKIPTSVGEFLHLYDMLSPSFMRITFRGIDVDPSASKKRKSRLTNTQKEDE